MLQSEKSAAKFRVDTAKELSHVKFDDFGDYDYPMTNKVSANLGEDHFEMHSDSL